MNFPCQYRYSPRGWIVAASMGTGILYVAGMSLICGCRPSTFTFGVGLAVFIIGLMAAARKFLLKQYLVMEEESLLVPTGFMGWRTVRIPYAVIKHVGQTYLPGHLILRITTDAGRFDIVSGLLPDMKSYEDIASFLHSRLHPPAPAAAPPPSKS